METFKVTITVQREPSKEGYNDITRTFFYSSDKDFNLDIEDMIDSIKSQKENLF